MAVAQRPADVLDAFRRAPVGFATRVLGVTPQIHQASILNSIRDNRRTLVVSCNSIGKDFIAGVATLWWMSIWEDDALVITTATTGGQVRDVQWVEIRNMHQKARVPLGGEMLEIEPRWRLSTKKVAYGISTRDEPERLQGRHRGHILIIITEASAVTEAVWRGLRTLMASGDVRLLALSNPTRTNGEVYDVASGRRKNWNVLQYGAYDLPNLRACMALGEHAVPDQCPNPYPYLITHEWVEEIKNDFGEDSDYFLVHCLGKFPNADTTALFPLAWIEEAFDRIQMPMGKRAGGLDVARTGMDRTAYAEIYGNTFIRIEEWPRQELTDTEEKVKGDVLSLQPKMPLAIDDTGLGGGVAPHLKLDYPHVDGVDFNTRAVRHDRFVNKSAEMYWRLRQRFDPNGDAPIALPPQHPLRRKLTAQLSRVLYIVEKGRIRIDKKGEGTESPDMVDAMILALEALDRDKALGTIEIL